MPPVFSANTTNLAHHLEHDHASELKTLKDNASHQNEKKQPKLTDRLTSAVRHMTRPKQNQVDESLHKMVVEKVLPFSLVESDSFREFVGALDSRFG